MHGRGTLLDKVRTVKLLKLQAVNIDGIRIMEAPDAVGRRRRTELPRYS